MASNRFVFDGLEELKEELRNLPKALTGEARHIVQGEANGAAVAVRRVYAEHRVSGHLANSVFVNERGGGQYGTAFEVRNTDPIAWLFDNGSQARHWTTGKPTGAMWGKTPPTHVFVRTMIAFRRTMYDKLRDLLIRNGLMVSGHAA